MSKTPVYEIPDGTPLPKTEQNIEEAVSVFGKNILDIRDDVEVVIRPADDFLINKEVPNIVTSKNRVRHQGNEEGLEIVEHLGLLRLLGLNVSVDVENVIMPMLEGGRVLSPILDELEIVDTGKPRKIYKLNKIVEYSGQNANSFIRFEPIDRPGIEICVKTDYLQNHGLFQQMYDGRETSKVEGMLTQEFLQEISATRSNHEFIKELAISFCKKFPNSAFAKKLQQRLQKYFEFDYKINPKLISANSENIYVPRISKKRSEFIKVINGKEYYLEVILHSIADFFGYMGFKLDGLPDGVRITRKFAGHRDDGIALEEFKKKAYIRE